MKHYIRKFSTKRSDYIIIGAGSAGCVLANRLSQFSPTTLIESGISDKGNWDSWKIQMPAALTYVLKTKKYNYQYYTEEQKFLNNRRLHWPRGKCLGGSSSHNAMVYIRGHALDFDRWQEEGAENWSYSDVLPYFKKAQQHELGEDDYRGGTGPLYTSLGKTKNILFDTFIEAGVQTGYNHSNDINGYQQEGFGYFDMNIKNGIRWNTSNAYLRSEKLQNLQILTNSTVCRIIFDNKKAIGVEYSKNDQKQIIYADKEVILSAGAINSPQILQLSGIGDSSHLESLKIDVIQDNKLIGQNLQDHIEVYMQFKCLQPITLYSYGSFMTSPYQKTKAGIDWFLTKKGICASNHFESGGFIRSDSGIKHPDIQYHFIPGAVVGQLDICPFHAFQAHVGTMRQQSKGYVRIKSSNPNDYPEIQPNLCSNENDLDEMVKAVELTEEIFNCKAWESYKGESINFKKEDMLNRQTKKEWLRKNIESAYHASCTLPMGKVTDSEGRLKGFQNLRIVDASIMPSIVSGNLNASVIMLAEKISDSILGKKEKKSHAPYFIDPQWNEKQR